ncbi:MAG: hypothetical protein HC850_11620 [Rhodomicrobium sp.]|nr:hypothetical protein [Rhodomicrobium sp.]
MVRLAILVVSVSLSSVAISGAKAGAVCFPVKTDNISLGEKPARAYAERSLAQGIEAESRRLQSTGAQIGRVVKKDLSCKHFPNVLGADEWRCTGEAEVCTKG